MAAFTALGVMAESLVTEAVSRRVESAERVDTTAAIAESTMFRLPKGVCGTPVQLWLVARGER